jgi:hypothetical protein
LSTVIAEDAADTTAVAFDTGSDHFLLPDAPFLFWRSDEDPQIEEWMEFEFPVLDVDKNIHSSFVPANIGDFIGFLDDLWDWIEFGLWVYDHRNTGSNLNSNSAAIFDQLCNYCASILTIYPFNSCFTQTAVDSWCDDNQQLNWCGTLTSDREKNAEISRSFPCHMSGNVQQVSEVAEDYVTNSWHMSLDWL